MRSSRAGAGQAEIGLKPGTGWGNSPFVRTNWLILGMMIPLAVALAVWQREPAAAPGRGLAALYAPGGVQVATADVDALLARGPSGGGAPESVPGAAELHWLDGLTDWLPEPKVREPLLVVLVEGDARVAVDRSGIPDERVVAETPSAFVVEGNRMVAGSRDAVGEILIRFGWVDRPLELFAVEARRARVAARRGVRNADVAAYPMLPTGTGTGPEIAQLRRSDQQRVGAAVGTIQDALR